ncbi:MAG: MFS transporter [Hyphomicrobium sp.]|nr:MFS transporter [Hyphomicrobium sp.]MBN9279880.1 MFS transporter [Hyphomicrobium sp.]
MNRAFLPILATLYLLGFANLFLRQSFGVVAPELEREMALSPAVLSTIASSLFFAYALMQVPTGMLLDRFGGRVVMSTMLVFTAIGTALFAAGGSAEMLTLARILMGIGTAGAFTGAFYVLVNWLPADRFVTQTGALNSFAAVGNLCATAPLSALIVLIGWRQSYWLFAACVAVLTLALAVIVRDAPPGHVPRTTKKETFREVLAGVREAVRQPGMKRLLVAGLPMSFSGVISGVWGAPYLKHIHALDNIERGSILLLMAIGGIGGHYFYGRVARYFNTLKWPMLVGGTIILTVAALMALMTRPPLWLVTTLFVIASICSAYPTIVMTHGRGLVPARLLGRGVAVANMGIMTAIAGAQFVFGWVVGIFPAMAGVPPEMAYRTAFGVQAAMALVGLVILGPIRDVHPRG